MTVIKSQGQTIPHVGIYLPKPILSHGQLYIALSRATMRQHVKLLAQHPNTLSEKGTTKRKKKASKPTNRKASNNNEARGIGSKADAATYTKNIVSKEVLTS